MQFYPIYILDSGSGCSHKINYLCCSMQFVISKNPNECVPVQQVTGLPMKSHPNKSVTELDVC